MTKTAHAELLADVLSRTEHAPNPRLREIYGNKLIAEGKDRVVDGGPRRLKTSGVIGAAFRHRTSRAGDPLLHWHVLIANMAEGSDGRWTAIVQASGIARQ